jgi:hypothetical protein
LAGITTGGEMGGTRLLSITLTARRGVLKMCQKKGCEIRNLSAEDVFEAVVMELVNAGAVIPEKEEK